HVLEHVVDDALALRELQRVLRPTGVAVLQTPFSPKLRRTLDDPGIDTDVLRTELCGQADHLRLYGSDIVPRFCAAGFVFRGGSHDELLPDVDAVTHGVNAREPFFLFAKA